MLENREQTQIERRCLFLLWGSIDLHSLHPWGRGGYLPVCKQRRTRAAPGRKQQESSPLPWQRKLWGLYHQVQELLPCSNMETSKREAKARKKHAATLASHRTNLPVAVEGMLWGPVSSKQMTQKKRCLCPGRKQARAQKEERGGTDMTATWACLE